MKNKLQRRKYVFVAGILLLVFAVVVLARRNGGERPIIRTDVVRRGTVTVSVSANGVLEPLTTVEVRSNVGGQVIELTVDEGEYVKAGQLIAKIDPSDSLTQLQQAEADLASARAQVEQAVHGARMQLLQTSAGIESAEQALAASKQRLAQAEQEAKIQPELTSQAIKQAKSALEAARANLDQVKTALVPQKIAAATAAYEQAKATFDQAEKDLKRKKPSWKKGLFLRAR
ncbi:MAG: efflux RND transporter periplasmic adaptor subunit [Armatimonadota bacterium]